VFIKDFISNEVPTLKPGDTVRQAMEMMEEFKVTHLPVMANGRHLGLMSERSLEACEDDALPIQGLELDLSQLLPDQHVFEAMALMDERHLSLLPVVNEEGIYLGHVKAKNVISAFAKTQAVGATGSIVVLEMDARDYSLAEISRLVESNGVKILSAMLTANRESAMVEVTLKMNKEDIQAVIQTFERYDYRVKAFFHAPKHADDLQRRFEAFMKYLNT
jgi:acetoin utilization protein AcuB